MSYDLWPRPYWPKAFGGRVMRVSDDLRKCVAFIGVGDEDTFEPGGTGFFVQYKKVIYFVTARHVMEDFGDDPLVLRLNDQNGGTFHVGYDGTVHGQEAPWYVSDDPSVDIAIVQAGNWRGAGADMLCLPETVLLREGQLPEEGIGVGDFCYAVGLFRLMSGKKRMLPFVHTGHIGMLPGDERIPVTDWRKGSKPADRQLVEGYLVEIAALEGLSGAPVFARASLNMMDWPYKDGKSISLNWPINKLHLLGVWQSSWRGDPDALLRAPPNSKVPVGIGIVAPTAKLISILESEPAATAREKFLSKLEAERIAKPD